MTTSVTQKGQITIPAPFRRQLGLKTGSKCRFMIRGDELILVPMRKEMGIADMQTLFKENTEGSNHFIERKALEKTLER
jgi:AbrB family looped-hinge helix DNA binding protein